MMKCDPSHRENSSGSMEVFKAGFGIIGYFTLYVLIACTVSYLLF
jgi:hypothetical protein